MEPEVVNDSIKEFTTMYISKSTMQDGLMKWSAVNSDTSKDLYGERMSLELYRKMLSYIKNSVPPPDDFRQMVCSDYWCGGMPYVSIAHYPDLNGKAVPGQPLELFIDGSQLKAKGILFDTPLGRAVWKSLKQDEMKQKSGADDEKIRISIAFLDLAHKHGENGTVFERKSIHSVCSQCAKGVGEKIYVDGYLVHLALTRVPVNPRTIMQAEDIMAKKSKIETRKEDALSIVQDETLVNELSDALSEKSDVLVEMSDTEVVESAQVELAKTPPMEEEEDMEEDEKPKDKKMSKKSLTDEDIDVIRSLIADSLPKAVVAPEPAPVQPVVEEKSALDLATDGLYNSINSAISLQGASVEQRLEAINPALHELGNAITALVRDSMGVEKPATVSGDQSIILEEVATLKSMVQELSQKLSEQTPAPAPVNRIPAPRAIQPAVVVQSQTANSVNPNSVSNVVRRSVSSQLPLK